MSSAVVPLDGNTDNAGGNARLSDDGLYRYWLTRWWRPVKDPTDRIAWVMLNPSTADASVDDPTIRRCVTFSKLWGFNGLVVVNVFALRATNPRQLAVADDPIGPDCDEHLKHWLASSLIAVAAWGQSWPESQRQRVEDVSAMLRLYGRAFALGTTQTGQPRHPLYIKGDTSPVRWP